MESHQLAQGLDDLLPYQERSLLQAAPYTLKDIKFKRVKCQHLALWVLCPSFGMLARAERGCACRSVQVRISVSRCQEFNVFLYRRRPQLVPYNHQWL